MYQHIKVPQGGQKISVNADYSLNVPDQPIIPCIEGDGTGLDITPVMLKVVDAAVAKSENERRAMWRIRDSVDNFFRYGPAFLYDVSLAIGDMDAYVTEVKRRLHEAYPDHHCFTLGHIGDGNIHFAIAVGSAAPEHHKRVNACVYEPLQPVGGSVSAEHGIGTMKVAALPRYKSHAELDALRAIKAAFDPKNILNPGKLVPPVLRL